MPTTVPALFVSHRAQLSHGGGGAQWCTREYREVLAAAGHSLHDVVYDTDFCVGPGFLDTRQS